MTRTRADLITTAAKRIGVRAGTVGTVTVGASTTTAVLLGLVNTQGDDTAYQNDRLLFLDSAEGSKETLITTWADATGTATFANLAAAPAEGDPYLLVPREDYTLYEYRDALNQAFAATKRTYRYTLPVVTGIDTYPLSGMTWLEGAGDVDATSRSLSPSLLQNEEFAYWDGGQSVAPDGWTLSAGSVARADGFGYGGYAATATRAGSDATLTQSLYRPLVQYLTRVASGSRNLQAGCWVTTSTASAARVGLYDGSSTTWSDYHAGDGQPHFLSTSLALTAAMTDLRIVLSVDTSDASATFQRAVCHEGNAVSEQLRDYGARSFTEIPAEPLALRNEGGIPTLTVPGAGTGQLVVYSRRPFPEMDADTDVIEDQYARAMEAGLLVYLSDIKKPNQDRTRLDRILAEERSRWTKANEQFVDLPVEAPVYQMTVQGA